MKIIVLDDEKLAVRSLLHLLGQVQPAAEAIGFTITDEALHYLSKHKADIIFLDIEIGAQNGIEVAQQCKNICPDINVIFVTGYSEYLMDAFRLHASGYLLKPIRAEDVKAEINNLRNPPSSPLAQIDSKRIKIQTFGNFEIFADGKILKFPRAKCKECLAYLVDRRGASITYPNLSAVLWEDKPLVFSIQNNTNKVVSDMMKTLKTVNAEDIIDKNRLGIAIIPALVDCDYYDVLKRKIPYNSIFNGEYMTNYSWSEFTLGDLTRYMQKNLNLI